MFTNTCIRGWPQIMLLISFTLQLSMITKGNVGIIMNRTTIGFIKWPQPTKPIEKPVIRVNSSVKHKNGDDEGAN